MFNFRHYLLALSLIGTVDVMLPPNKFTPAPLKSIIKSVQTTIKNDEFLVIKIRIS